jgi:hypothetical protein
VAKPGPYLSGKAATNQRLPVEPGSFQEAWLLPGAFLIPPALLVVADFSGKNIFSAYKASTFNSSKGA